FPFPLAFAYDGWKKNFLTFFRFRQTKGSSAYGENHLIPFKSFCSLLGSLVKDDSFFILVRIFIYGTWEKPCFFQKLSSFLLIQSNNLGYNGYLHLRLLLRHRQFIIRRQFNRPGKHSLDILLIGV